MVNPSLIDVDKFWLKIESRSTWVVATKDIRLTKTTHKYLARSFWKEKGLFIKSCLTGDARLLPMLEHGHPVHASPPVGYTSLHEVNQNHRFKITYGSCIKKNMKLKLKWCVMLYWLRYYKCHILHTHYNNHIYMLYLYTYTLYNII